MGMKRRADTAGRGLFEQGKENNVGGRCFTRF